MTRFEVALIDQMETGNDNLLPLHFYGMPLLGNFSGETVASALVDLGCIIILTVRRI